MKKFECIVLITTEEDHYGDDCRKESDYTILSENTLDELYEKIAELKLKCESSSLTFDRNLFELIFGNIREVEILAYNWPVIFEKISNTRAWQEHNKQLKEKKKKLKANMKEQKKLLEDKEKEQLKILIKRYGIPT